jgi:hypothetical protein
MWQYVFQRDISVSIIGTRFRGPDLTHPPGRAFAGVANRVLRLISCVSLFAFVGGVAAVATPDVNGTAGIIVTNELLINELVILCASHYNQ